MNLIVARLSFSHWPSKSEPKQAADRTALFCTLIQGAHARNGLAATPSLARATQPTP